MFEHRRPSAKDSGAATQAVFSSPTSVAKMRAAAEEQGRGRRHLLAGRALLFGGRAHLHRGRGVRFRGLRHRGESVRRALNDAHVLVGGSRYGIGGGTRAIGCRADERERLVDVVRHALELADLRLAALHRRVGLRDAGRHRARELHDVVGRRARLIGKLSDLVRDDTESATGGAGARGFDRGVEREEIGLIRDAPDRHDELVDVANRRVQRANFFRRLPHDAAHVDEDRRACARARRASLRRRRGSSAASVCTSSAPAATPFAPSRDVAANAVTAWNLFDLRLCAARYLGHRFGHLRGGVGDLLRGSSEIARRVRDVVGGPRRDLDDASERFPAWFIASASVANSPGIPSS